VFNPASELSYNDYTKTFHTIALCVGIIDISHRYQGVYAYYAKLDGRIVFMRHGGELESEFFDMISWHAPFFHVARLPNEPRNKIASLCAYYFICAYIVDQIVEIGEFTPEKLKELSWPRASQCKTIRISARRRRNNWQLVCRAMYCVRQHE
jgi:hypothetical protein